MSRRLRLNGFTFVWDRKHRQLKLSAEGTVTVIAVLVTVAALVSIVLLR